MFRGDLHPVSIETFLRKEVSRLPEHETMNPEARRSRRKERRRTPWSNLELAVFAIAVLIFLSMTGSALAFGLHAYNEVKQDRKDAAANHQEYVTFFRDVVSHMALEDGKTTTQQSDLDVDLTQFERDEGYAGQLYAMREQLNGRVEVILSYYENAVCTVNGEEKRVGDVIGEQAIPERFVQLAAENHEALDFVADYPEKHDNAGSLKPEERKSTTKVPLYIQWDESWGYESYGEGTISYSGCAPTTMAMAVSHLTDQAVTPLEVCRYAEGEGFYIPGTGTDWKFITEGAEHYGLFAQSLDTYDEEKLAKELEVGHLVICSMSPGDFTQNGHFILLTGYEDGQFSLNDPNSLIRSGQTWTFERLSGQIRQLWAISPN